MSLTLATVTTQFLERPGLSISTQKSYELTLLPLLQEYGRYPIEIVGRAAIEEYLNGLTHLAYTTHHRHQSIIQALLNFAVEQEYIKVNPIAHLRRRKPDVSKGEHTSDRVIRYLSVTQLQQMYEAIAPDCRLNTIVRLLHRSGARIAELLALNLEDLDLQGQKFQVVGKGNKTRWCFYSEDAALLIDKYLKYYRHQEHPALWTAQHRLSKKVVRLSYPNIHQRWRDLTDPFPLTTGIRLHDLRHTFATERVGLIGIEELRALMGHQNIQTTLRYQKVTSERAELVAQTALNKLLKSDNELRAAEDY
jgi:integrase/recombinase XerD